MDAVAPITSSGVKSATDLAKEQEKTQNKNLFKKQGITQSNQPSELNNTYPSQTSANSQVKDKQESNNQKNHQKNKKLFKNKKKPNFEPVPLTPIEKPATQYSHIQNTPTNSHISPQNTPQAPHKVNFASDLHDGRPGFATSQNLPGKHQLGETGFRQNLQGNSNSPDSGYFSIHH